MISYIEKDTYGLSPEQKEYIRTNAEEFGFDFIKYCDELSITISKDTKNSNKLDICVLVKGISKDDERGNGYFGYNISLSYLKYLMEKSAD